MNLSTSYELLSNDDEIKLYFKERELYTFIKMYIKVDQILGVYFKKVNDTDTKQDSDTKQKDNDEFNQTISKELLLIKDILSKNSSNLENLQSNIVSSNNKVLSSLNNYKSDKTNEELYFKDELKRELKNLLDNFNNRINNSNNRNVDELSKRSLDIISKLQETLLLSLDSHSINYKIQSIEKVLNTLHNNLSGTVVDIDEICSDENVDSEKKYATNRTLLLKNLTRTFDDSEIIDVYSQKNAGDLHIIKENHPTILIDSKYDDDTISVNDLERFYTNIKLQNCCGILCNAFGGIANRKHFSIDFIDSNIVVFIHNHRFDHRLFALATNMIYTIHDQIKDKMNDGILMDNRLFNHLKTEYNVFMQSYDCHLDLIQHNLNALYELKFKSLDHFFKRKSNVTLEVKKFTCHLCSTGCASEKTLKKHYKEIHQLMFNTKYKNNENINPNDMMQKYVKQTSKIRKFNKKTTENINSTENNNSSETNTDNNNSTETNTFNNKDENDENNDEGNEINDHDNDDEGDDINDNDDEGMSTRNVYTLIEF